ncbi:hypothetical protein IAT40_006395 [Kwoniella sp. CBS 6097]
MSTYDSQERLRFVGGLTLHEVEQEYGNDQGPMGAAARRLISFATRELGEEQGDPASEGTNGEDPNQFMRSCAWAQVEKSFKEKGRL